MALECHVQWMNPSMINEYLMSGARGVWRGEVAWCGAKGFTAIRRRLVERD